MLTPEALACGTPVYAEAPHLFGEDALLLARFAKPKTKQSACDLGTGCGIIPLSWHDSGHRGACVAVDICADAIALLEAALTDVETAQPGAAAHLVPICADLRVWRPEPKLPAVFDLVACNPPYFTGGRINANAARAVARHALAQSCTFDEVCAAATRLLRNGGRFCVCQKPEQLTDVLCAMRNAHIEPKRLQFVQPDARSAPWLFLAEGQKNRAPGLHILSPLLTKKTDGTPLI